MEKEVRKILNSKLGATSLNEVMPEFNKDEIWERLSPRLIEKKKRVIPIWWAYAAAAMVVGLVFGRIGFEQAPHNDYYVNGNLVIEAASNVLKENRAKLVAQIPSSPIIKEQSTDRALTISEHKSKQTTHNQTIVRINTDTSYEYTSIAPIRNDITADTADIPIAVKQNSRKTRAVHLLDLNTDDKSALINITGSPHTLQNHFTLFTSAGPTGSKESKAKSSFLELHLR